MASGGIIFTPSFMTIMSGIQIITIMLLPKNLRSFSVGISDGRNNEVCCCDELRWLNILAKFHDVRYRHLKIGMGGYIYRHTRSKMIS